MRPSCYMASIDLRMATTQYLLLKNTKNILNSYGRETHINLHALLRGLFRPLSLHQTYETWVFVPQGIRTYLKWLPWWLLFNKMLPWGVPTQHWWYPNPASRFRFSALWSQSSDNANPDLPAKLQLAAQRILESKSPTIRGVTQLLGMMVSSFPKITAGILNKLCFYLNWHLQIFLGGWEMLWPLRRGFIIGRQVIPSTLTPLLKGVCKPEWHHSWESGPVQKKAIIFIT